MFSEKLLKFIAAVILTIKYNWCIIAIGVLVHLGCYGIAAFLFSAMVHHGLDEIIKRKK
jgi:ABC-type uncharacterized transport system permease subunit